MRLAYLVVHLLPTFGFVALVWTVARAVSVRIVWRDASTDRLDDKAA